MSKYDEIFEYMRQCPNLSDLWSIGAREDMGVSVILPQGSSEIYSIEERGDTLGRYECDMIPFLSIFEDYQINCFRFYDSGDSSSPASNINVMALDEVQDICDWVIEQNQKANLPRITGRNVVSIECFPINPQIRFVDEEKNLIGYFITIRIRYVNPYRRIYREFETDGY